ncbi:hypothetical protein ACGE0T_20360 [Parabacteroides sp. APC149_11_2_Y6]
MAEKTLLDLYHRVNDRSTPRFVYHLGGDSGFFSEYNNMILAILYCLDKKIRFSIYSKDANFKYKEGWNDYFSSFCEEGGNFLHAYFNRRPNPRFKYSLLRKADALLTNTFRSVNPRKLTTFDLWDAIRSQNLLSEYNFPELGLKGDLRAICRRLIEMTWVYNEETEKEVQRYKRSANLPNQYIGFHIRGGDKFSEAEILGCRQYIGKAEQLSDIRSAFVLTDDYAVIEELEKNYPSWSFRTFCGKEERGYFHNTFKHEAAEVKKNRYIKLFASMDVLAEAELFIGTFSSNPGMYLGMRMSPEKAYSIDIPDWRIW